MVNLVYRCANCSALNTAEVGSVKTLEACYCPFCGTGLLLGSGSRVERVCRGRESALPGTLRATRHGRAALSGTPETGRRK